MSSAATGTRQRIFVSYRRGETSGHAGRIYDAMVGRFGEDNVFMDVELAPGVDFVDHITDVVSSCTVLIAVMGKAWADAPGPDGSPRLHDEADFVRLEVATAIQNPDVTVIPALVDEAQMPKAEQLPEEMRPLARRNALELSDGRWRYDVGRLNDTLEQLLEGLTGFPQQVQPEPATPVPPPPQPEPVPAPPSPTAAVPAVQLLIEGVLVAAFTAFLARSLAAEIPKLHKEIFGGQIDPVIRQTFTWALVGTALALWLGARNRRTDFLYLGLLGLLVGALAGTIGSMLWAVSVAPPPARDWTPPEIRTAGKWAVVNFAVTGALLGALIGAVWRRPNLVAGLAGGLLAGALSQVILNGGDWNTDSMPGVAFVFAFRAAAIAGGALAVMLVLSRRSSSSARGPAAR